MKRQICAAISIFCVGILLCNGITVQATEAAAAQTETEECLLQTETEDAVSQIETVPLEELAVEIGQWAKEEISEFWQELSQEEPWSSLEKLEIIASFQTSATSDSNRDQNLKLACEAINGIVVEPGEEFSFNEATGRRTTEKGYLPATAYVNGAAVQAPGGGVCQVSTTLYNAVVSAGLDSTERSAHTYAAKYVDPGADAAVSYGGPDFCFVNNSEYPVKILASAENADVSVSLLGVPLLEEGEELRMESVCVSGNTWVTYLVRYQDGEEVERSKFHNSHYS